MSFLLLRNHPISSSFFHAVLIGFKLTQGDDCLKKEATCFFDVKVSAVLDVTVCVTRVETT